MSILIAEDNVAQRHYLREILEKEFPSHTPVLEACDGEETVKLAIESKPEICILDIQMPKLSGSEGCARNLARVSRSADYLLDSVPTRDLHQRNPQDR